MANVIEDDELELNEELEVTEVNDGDEELELGDEDGDEIDEIDEIDEGDPDPNVQATDEEKAQFKAEDEAKAKADADEKAAKKAEREAANEVALNTFKTAVEEVMASDSLDATTGEPTTEHLSQVGVAYSGFASKAGQNAALAYLNEQMQVKLMEAAANPASFVQARTYLELSNHLKSIGQIKETIVRKPVDPTEAHVARVAALLLAPNFVVVPEGVAEDWQDKARAKATELHEQAGQYITWQRQQAALTDEERAAQGEETGEPAVDDIVKAAARIAGGRAVGTPRAKRAKGEGTPSAPRAPYEGTRRDIGAHIRAAFEGVEVGAFLTVGEIVKFVSSEYPEGPENRPSQGAVAARLFPKSGNCTIEGIRPEGPTQGRSHKGAVKTA